MILAAIDIGYVSLQKLAMKPLVISFGALRLGSPTARLPTLGVAALGEIMIELMDDRYHQTTARKLHDS